MSISSTLIGEDPAFLATLDHLKRLAAVDKPCLVVGERGSGKEMLAERLHYLSSRWQGPMVRVNCAALSDALLDTELFGHEAGAFTGAQKRHRGRFERAHGGTLILDEIATASDRVQEKLLRAVEYGEIERVGGDDVLKVDVRVVGSTNEDLPDKVAKGAFRADLLDRLSFDVVTVPPLRARPLDVLLLAEDFALAMTKQLARPFFPGFAPSVKERLVAHPWPGNVRELKNVVERSVYLHGEEESPIARLALNPFDSPWRLGGAKEEVAIADDIPAEGFTVAVASFEKSLVKQALDRNRNNQGKAADALQLGYHQFRRLMKKHGLS